MASATTLQIDRWCTTDGLVQVSRIDGASGTKAYVCVRPEPRGGVESQAQQVYERLGRLLKELGATPQAVVSEKLFLADITDVDSVGAARDAVYGLQLQRPATTWVQQPPCPSEQRLELQARVLYASRAGHDVRLQSLAAELGAGQARRVSSQGYEHYYAHNITGGETGDGLDAAAQMADVFERAQSLLMAQGLTFRDVIRTWLYLPDMEGDYGELNRVRTGFFDRVGVRHPPASTGIQGGVHPADRRLSMDLYALGGDTTFDVRLMHAPTLNEAWSYGSSFARGMEVTRRDRTVLYVSGTASIDEDGQVVAVGDIEGQVRRMLQNVEALLAGSQATPADLVRATTYLKDPAYQADFARIWREGGWPLEIPHTVCVADVCRPDWLCEIEVAAVLPRTAGG